MAEKQFALGGSRSAGYLEDEDPLAELARIVGFQEQAAPRSRPQEPERKEPVITEFPASVAVVAPDAEAPPAQPANPVANMEDELLRAFEVYDGPRAETPEVSHQTEAAPAQVATPAPVSVQPQAVADDEEDPFSALAAVVAASAPAAQAYRAPAAPQAAPAAVERVEPSFQMSDIDTASMPEFSVDLLEEELMQTLGEADLAGLSAPVAAAAPEIEAARPATTRPEGLRLPLANFHAQQNKPQPARSEPSFEEAAPVVAERDVRWDLSGDAISAEDVVISEPPRPSAGAQTSMNDLLDEVSRYELPKARTPDFPRRDPAFDASLAAISGVASGITEPRAPEPVAQAQPAPAAEQPEAPRWSEPEPRYEPTFEAMQAEAPVNAEFEDPFASAEFGLDIEDFEQELSSITLDDTPPMRQDAQESYYQQAAEPVRQDEPPLEPFADFAPESEAHSPMPQYQEQYEEQQQEPYQEQAAFNGRDAREELRFELAREAKPMRVADAMYEQAFEPRAFTAQKAAQVVYEPAPVAAQMPAPMPAPYESTYQQQPAMPEFNPDEGGSFDPAKLSESEDAVEAVGEIDVPELKVPEPEPMTTPVPDYDLDIDAEMANLFGTLPQMAVNGQAGKSSTEAFNNSAFGGNLGTSSAPVDTFDEFERALEDDFRSMLTQPLGQPHAVSGMPLTPPVVSRREGGTLRAMLLAACATGVIALVGLGGYMFFADGGAGLTSSEPRIIAADKGPVKVAPANPGGVTVPNQDKAVYDRVAGKEVDVVKQNALVTTEEEPVDVVQKTLVPDNTLDAEASADAADSAPAQATPVEDTKDARLLPSDTAAAGADAQQAAPGGVAVRKVRTMIVKADGTLVPREDPPATTPETTAAVPVASAAPSLSQPAATLPAAADGLRTDDQVAAPAENAPVSDETLASVANSDVNVTAPVRTVKTSNISDSAPVPTARPSDQPVNVVGAVTENGNVRPVAAPQETASAEPAAAPAEPAAAPAPTGSYGIQIASLPSEADAKASIPKMSAKFGNVLGGRPIGIRQANIPNKGTYYRLRVDVGTKEQAIALCGKLKASGGSCLVSK